MNLFQKSLEDIQKGSKNSSVDLTTYNFQCYQEMKEEVKSSDVNVKAKAILKYFYVIIAIIFPLLIPLATSS